MEQSVFNHIPVMMNEVIQGLQCDTNKLYVDATSGGGGHSLEIAKRVCSDGNLISFDVDPFAVETARKKLADFADNAIVINENYNQIPSELNKMGIEKITGGILFDLGASTYQLTTAEKGFSFRKEAPLDMRFDPNSNFTAYHIINSYTQEELIKIFSEYGEERFSGRIARNIVEYRQNKNIETTLELADIIKKAVPKVKTKIHPATRVFQAVRIEVNNELKNFEKSFKNIMPILETGARIVVITFHSLEDRLVKNLFKYYSTVSNCPIEYMSLEERENAFFEKKLEIITKRPLFPSDKEIEKNPSARSAKVRIAKRV